MSHAVPETELPPRAHHLPAAGAVVVATALLTVLPAVLGDAGLVAAVLVVQLGLVGAWVVATGIRGSLGSLAIGGVAAAGADLALLLPDRPRLDHLVVVLGLSFLVAVLHQMVRPAPRRYLVASLAGVVLLVCAVCSLAVLLTVAKVDDGLGEVITAVLVVGAAVVAGHLVDLVLPRPRITEGVPRGMLGLVLGVLAGVVVALLRRETGDLVDVVSAVTTGGALGGVAVLMSLGASYVVAERAQRGWALPVVQAALPVAAAAPVAYALALYAST